MHPCCVGWASCPGCVWGRTSIIPVVPYKHSGTFRFASLNTWGTTEVWIPVTHSKSVTLCPQSTVSCPPSWCHDNSGHRECFVFNGLGTSQVQSLPSPLACGHNTQVPCTHVVWDGLHVLGVFGAGPVSFLLCHTSTVKRLDLRV